MTLITLLFGRTFSIVGDILWWSHVKKAFCTAQYVNNSTKKCSMDSTAVSQLVHVRICDLHLAK